MSVLGSILQDADAFERCAAILRPEDFFRASHGQIVAATLDVSRDRGEVVDLTTLSNELRRRGELEEIGSHACLCSLIEHVPTAANVMHQARIVKEKSLDRKAVLLQVDGLNLEISKACQHG